VDSKAEYSALSSTRSQKKKLKTNNASALLIQYRLRTVKSVRMESGWRYSDPEAEGRTKTGGSGLGIVKWRHFYSIINKKGRAHSVFGIEVKLDEYSRLEYTCCVPLRASTYNEGRKLKVATLVINIAI